MKDLWRQALEQLREELPQHTFNTWFRPLEYQSVDSGRLVVGVPNGFYRDRVQRDYAEMLRYRLRQLSGGESVDVAFVVKPRSDAEPALLKDITRVKRELEKRERSESAPEGLLARYTFETFVVGAGSEFSYAAARAVADEPGTKYNPLFIYGGVGLGKTHLLSAIGNRLVRLYSPSRILFRTSEQFTNELILAIRYEKTVDFRKRYRDTCDVLLIDDVQFMAGKERTQEEFFHTFNTLHAAGRQIVMTSDRTPAEIAELDERLRSRFQWGLLGDLQPPDLETRAAILTKKADSHGVDLPEDVALFLAGHITSNVRVLEGALVRLLALASLSKRPVTLDLTREVFQTLETEEAPISIDLIQRRVAEFFNLSVGDLRSPRRQRIVAQPRQIAMYLSRKLTRASYPEIGHQFGGKDHSTVMHGVSKIERQLASDPRLRQTLSALEQNLAT